jgi:hypothetical protein
LFDYMNSYSEPDKIKGCLNGNDWPLLPWQELGEGVLPFYVVDYLDSWQIDLVKSAKQNQTRLVIVDDIPAIVRQKVDGGNTYVFFQDVPGLQNAHRSLSKTNDDLERKNKQTGTYFWKKAKLITVEGSEYFPNDNKPGVWAYLAPTDKYQAFRTTLGGFWFDARSRQLLTETTENAGKVQLFNSRLAAGLLRRVKEDIVDDKDGFVMVSGAPQTTQDDKNFGDFMTRTGASPSNYFSPDTSTTTIYYDDEEPVIDPVIDPVVEAVEPVYDQKKQNLALRKSEKYGRYLNKKAQMRSELDEESDDMYEPIVPTIVDPPTESETVPAVPTANKTPSFALALLENLPAPVIKRVHEKNEQDLQTKYAAGTTALIIMMILL